MRFELGPGQPPGGWSRREKRVVKELGNLETWADKTRERVLPGPVFNFAAKLERNAAGSARSRLAARRDRLYRLRR